MDLSFSERLSELIFESGQTVRELSSKIGVGKTPLYEYLSGVKMPSLANLIKIADYFQCSTDFILGLESENNERIFKKCKPFSVQFQESLTALGVSRYKLEKLTGIAESALYYWAKGQKTPSVESLTLVCKKLDCRFDFFIGRSTSN